MIKESVKRYIEGDGHYWCIGAYEKVDNPTEWEPCPNCGLIPKVWIYDNGRSTACGCGKSPYDHFSIEAEDIMSVVKRSPNGQSLVEYDRDALRKNWNHWVRTGEILYNREA